MALLFSVVICLRVSLTKASYSSVNKTKLAVTVVWGKRLSSSVVIHGVMGLLENSCIFAQKGFKKDASYFRVTHSFQIKESRKKGRGVVFPLYFFFYFFYYYYLTMTLIRSSRGTLLFMQMMSFWVTGCTLCSGTRCRSSHFYCLPQTAGICTTGDHKGNQQLAFSPQRLQTKTVE